MRKGRPLSGQPSHPRLNRVNHVRLPGARSITLDERRALGLALTETFYPDLGNGFNSTQFASSSSANWCPRYGFEPRTCSLQNCCSTTELRGRTPGVDLNPRPDAYMAPALTTELQGFGTSGRPRTCTDRCLRPVPLPVGLQRSGGRGEIRTPKALRLGRFSGPLQSPICLPFHTDVNHTR